MTGAEHSGRRDALRCAIGAVLLVLALRLTIPAAICDDAYITMTMGRSLAEGRGLTFNPGEPLHVSTAPLWALLIALVRAAGVDAVLATRVLGATAEMALAVGMVRLGRIAAGSARVGLVAAVLLATNPAQLLTSFSGMELPLYLAAIAWSLGFAIERRFAPALAIAALAVWIRVDGVLLYLMATALHLRAARSTPGATMMRQLPSLAIVAGYVVFGLLVFGDPVPITVLRKVGEVVPFGREWFAGATLLAANFVAAFAGAHLHWYRQLGPLVVAPVFLVAGLVAIVRERLAAMGAPLAFALAYMVVVVASGRAYAGYFPWYFMPPLVGLTLVAALGVSRIARRLAPAREPRLLAGFAAVWAVVMAVSGYTAARTLAVEVRERERAYAAAAAWLSRHLPRDGRIAANEIGTVGFYKRDDLRVLDLFGLLRTRVERDRPGVELVADHRPEAVITRDLFSYRDAIDDALPGAYVWMPLRGVMIGLRTDLAPRLLARRPELDGIDRSFDLGRESRDRR